MNSKIKYLFAALIASFIFILGYSLSNASHNDEEIKKEAKNESRTIEDLYGFWYYDKIFLEEDLNTDDEGAIMRLGTWTDSATTHIDFIDEPKENDEYEYKFKEGSGSYMNISYFNDNINSVRLSGFSNISEEWYGYKFTFNDEMDMMINHYGDDSNLFGVYIKLSDDPVKFTYNREEIRAKIEALDMFNKN